MRALLGYALDAAAVGDPRRPQSFSVPSGDGVIDVPILVKKASDGTPQDLTGGALFLTMKQGDATIVKREATFDNAFGGSAHWPLVTADTVGRRGEFTFDVKFVDAQGNTFQVVLLSFGSIGEVLYDASEPVTVPASQQPLAQGPPGVGYDNEGRLVFANQQSQIVNLPVPYSVGVTDFQVWTSIESASGEPNAAWYQIISNAQIRVGALSPFTGAICWGTRR